MQFYELADLSDDDLQHYLKLYAEQLNLGFRHNSLELAVGSCFILFCASILINSGSSLTMTQNKSGLEDLNQISTLFNIPSQAAVNTIMSTAGAVSCYLVLGLFSTTSPMRSENNAVTLKCDLVMLVEAVMAGWISVKGSCNNIETEHALVIGIIGVLIQ